MARHAKEKIDSMAADVGSSAVALSQIAYNRRRKEVRSHAHAGPVQNWGVWTHSMPAVKTHLLSAVSDTGKTSLAVQSLDCMEHTSGCVDYLLCTPGPLLRGDLEFGEW